MGCEAPYGSATIAFYSIEACALFNFYNRFVSGNGVKLVSDEAFRRLGERMARVGYRRKAPPKPNGEMHNA